MENDEQVINGITMPPLYNKRAGHMWDIISQHVDFKGKRVIDLGCGHGDLLVRIYASAPRYIAGYDYDLEVLNDTRRKMESMQGKVGKNGTYQIYLGQCDIESDLCQKNWRMDGVLKWDIAICCSVLPYLQHETVFLEDLLRCTDIAIIERQYSGDGPGSLANDDEMKWVLSQVGWSTVTPIGKTFVEGRDKWRTIWKCER